MMPIITIGISRSINKKVQQVMMQVGFIILIALMIFILFVDIFNIFS